MSNNADLSTVSGVQAYLETTPFASHLVTPVSGGFANFSFRLHLNTPYDGHTTLILKHAKPYIASEVNFPFAVERQDFEVEALKRVRQWLHVDSIVTVPAVHHFDKEAHIIIMDDCGVNAITLKRMMQTNLSTAKTAEEIGAALGRFLRSLHEWGKDNQTLLKFFDANEQAKSICAFVTYGRLISTLTGKDELPALSKHPLEFSQQDLDTITEISNETSLSMTTEKSYFTMGDFWPGNIMVSMKGNDITRIHILDWEAARPGLPGLEIGQFCAEMDLLRRFYPVCRESASTTIIAFLIAYRGVHDVDIPLARQAIIHMGAHLVAWTPRVPWGTEEQVRDTVKDGAEIILKSYDGTKEWLEASYVSSLLF